MRNVPRGSGLLAAVVELLPGVLESQLRRDAGLSRFEYWVLAMLSEAPERTLRMSALAAPTSAILPRLFHVVHRLEDRVLLERFPCPTDRRATNARPTAGGWAKVREAASGHLDTVRHHVVDAPAPEQLAQLAGVTEAILDRVDPGGAVTAQYRADAPTPG